MYIFWPFLSCFYELKGVDHLQIKDLYKNGKDYEANEIIRKARPSQYLTLLLFASFINLFPINRFCFPYPYFFLYPVITAVLTGDFWLLWEFKIDSVQLNSENKEQDKKDENVVEKWSEKMI